MKALRNDYIWLSLAKDFTDKTDSTIDFSFANQQKKIEKLIEKELPALIFNQMRNDMYYKKKINPVTFNGMTFDQFIVWVKNYIYKTTGNLKIGKVRNHLRTEGMKRKAIKKFEDELKKLTSKERQKEIADKIIGSFSELNKHLRELYYIYCFSGTFDNRILWENYADKDEGFCIEYDLSDQSKKEHPINNNNTEIFPILYTSHKKIEYTEIIKIGIQNHLKEEDPVSNNKFMTDVLSAMLTKNSRYSFEDEWRLIVDKKMVKNNEYPFPFASAIYLGINVTEDNKNKILEITREKNIKVYQRKINHFNNGYEFELIC